MTDNRRHVINIRMENGWPNVYCTLHDDRCQFGEASRSEGTIATLNVVKGDGWFPLTVAEDEYAPGSDEPTWEWTVIDGPGGV